MSDRALSILIHGPSKSGKSTYAVMTSPAPRLILDVESAARFMTQTRKVSWDPMTSAPPVHDGTWDTCVVTIRNYEVATRTYDWLKSGQHPFKTVILDSLTELQAKAQEAVNGRDKMKMQNWGDLFSKLRFFCTDLRDLTTNENKPIEAVVLVASTKVKNEVYSPALQGQTAELVPYLYDVTGYFYMDQVIDPTTGTPSEVRHLYTGSNPGFVSGSRAPLPEDLTNPSITGMLDYIFGAEVASEDQA